ncbi:DUF1488 domain-containing protein [Parashewanella spongiae]|uniref:DUF1488 domain-containing protein n=1 Tax=Parashewanella spongiae TaxID=342950 RepID=A0A3A6TCY9_9GAMM|nr:DUF1488 family protein [Parashewanella spongiae]MCL1079289.1 DUF1488 domain-containing protein [Parashewanella spongiae]RJY10526.1 DUF1488 domain-containing protein [Parashewanella spongiae]
MNQSVIFTDSLEFNTKQNTIKFTAQSMGVDIPCYISTKQLSALLNEKVEPEKAMEVAESFRFDIEEHFEEKIDAEEFDENGAVFY